VDRPYASVAALEEAGERIGRELSREDCLQAFAAHPKIGQQPASRWSQQEQAGAAAAEQATLDELAELNRRYEERFGYIYIVCATGRTASEMLSLLRRRLQNEPAAEFHEAAAEQRKITQLRLRKLVSE
jgi:OHCU decarboxylase